jgi:hypothetical protein
MICASAYLYAVPSARTDWVIMTAIVPAVWTAAIIAAYCREVLQLSRERAIVKTGVHQGLTFLVSAAYFAWAVQLWPRVLAIMNQ